jgi:hypothetical protein
MAQANASTITIPVAAPAAATVYLPIIHSRRYGEYLPELPLEASTRAAVIADIASGQHDGVSRVMAFDLPEGTAWDASEEIAEEVLDRVLDRCGEIPGWCIDFIEKHVGVNTAKRAERQWQEDNGQFGVGA